SASPSFLAINQGSMEMLRTNQSTRAIVSDSPVRSKPGAASLFTFRVRRIRDSCAGAKRKPARLATAVATRRIIFGSLGVSARRAETRPWDLIRFIPAWESEPSPLTFACLTLQENIVRRLSFHSADAKR